jgi:type II secretory pathway pseudopilin PulG
MSIGFALPGVGDDPARSMRSAMRNPHSAFSIQHSAFPPTPSPQPPASARRALTLIEMLVALAVTLVMMAAVVNLFANISGSIRNRRAVIEVSGQLRQVRQRLALDLAGATCKARTWQRSSSDPGYIEILEGERNDADPSILTDGDYANSELEYSTSLVPSGGDPTMTATTPARAAGFVMPTGAVTNGGALGDWDDILALTVQSESEPFKAEVDNALIESQYAEVFWYAMENPATVENPEIPGMRRIYRRVLLIAPWLGPWTYSAGGLEGRPQNVSVRFLPGSSPNTGLWVANTLGDLTKRENRGAYRDYDPSVPASSVFPHDFNFGRRFHRSEFVVLADALAFDVRVFDPGAPLFTHEPTGAVLEPSDPGFHDIAVASKSAGGPLPSGYGAYVDMGWLDVPPIGPNPYGSAIYNPFALSAAPPTNPTFGFLNRINPSVNYYDTWSFHYENDGINQDEFRAPPVPDPATIPEWWKPMDQGTNGLDDDGINGVDDPRERETGPQYDVPLRGIKVSLRIYERDARQIRETSVTHAFTQ